MKHKHSLHYLCKRIVKKFFILQIIFFSGALHGEEKTLNDRELKIQAEAFLKKFLLEEGAVYTLFGTKPMTDILIFQGDPKDICVSALSKESLEMMDLINDETPELFKSWKKFSQNLNLKNFILFEKTSPYDPLYTCYFVLNIQNAKKIFLKNESLFRKKLGEKICFNDLIQEAQLKDSAIWQTILRDHELSGILHGYGKENIESFTKKEKVQFLPRKKIHDFPLPNYAVSEKDKTTKIYKKEKKKIKKIYKNGDFLEISIRKLIN